jgi:hypothetical protein
VHNSSEPINFHLRPRVSFVRQLKSKPPLFSAFRRYNLTFICSVVRRRPSPFVSIIILIVDQPTLSITTITDNMLFATALVAALASTCQGFTPISTSRQWKSFTSSTSLYDSEQSVWSPPPADHQIWNTESITTAALKDRETFAPSPDDLKAVRKIKKPDFKADIKKTGIESEYPAKKKGRVSVKETGYDSMRNYIKSMCNHELLNKNEEIILAREIQILLKWEEERENLEAKLLR